MKVGFLKLVKRESKFLTELKKSFHDKGAFFYKISDSFHSGGLRFDSPKPFDVFGCYNGIPFAIEAKTITDYKSFGIGFLRDCQVDGLSAWSNAGGRSFVFLNIRRGGNKSRGIKRLNRLIVFKWKELQDVGRNIRKKDLEFLPFVDGKKSRFDLSVFLEQLC